MFCPRCRAEYREGFSTCSDCLVPLVDRLPAEDPAPEPSEPDRPRGVPRRDLELVTVFATSDRGLVGLVKSLLRSADIEFMVRGEELQDLFGIGRLAFNPLIGPVEFLVATEDADDARQLLADLTAAGWGDG